MHPKGTNQPTEDEGEDNCEGKSLDEPVGEGQIATPETEKVPMPKSEVYDWLKAYNGKTVEEMLQNKPTGTTVKYDPNTKILTIGPTSVMRQTATPQTEEEMMKLVDFKVGIFGMCSEIELVKSKVKNWMEHPELVGVDISEKPLNKGEEMEENLILAYRHLEDARMRLGKAVQAFDGGKSCYSR